MIPFVFWGILVVIARVWKLNLRPTLPLLRMSRWFAWIVGILLVTAALGSLRHFWLFPMGMSLTSLSAGLALVQGWVKRQYAPELLDPKSDSPLPAVHK